MPLKKGKSKKVQKQNFHELRQGEQYQKTKEKFGKKKANAQMTAIVLHKAGISKKPKKPSWKH